MNFDDMRARSGEASPERVLSFTLALPHGGAFVSVEQRRWRKTGRDFRGEVLAALAP